MTASESGNPGEQRVFVARLAMLPETAAFAQSFCDRRGIGRSCLIRLTLILEELFTNTVQHGYRGESDSPVRVTLGTERDGIALLYEDAAPQYDPLSRSSGSARGLMAPVDSRPVGGLGVHLVGHFVQRARYAREDGYNRLWLSIALDD